MSASPSRVSTGLVLVLTLVATAPIWMMGWLRDDWLMLWHALDPSTAPVRATGFFPRPVADFVWRLATTLGGDSPHLLHLFTVVAWAAIATGALRWHHAWGGRGLVSAAVLGAFVVAHGALVELRVWAAASNGVFAAAFAIWGVWWLRSAALSDRRLALPGVLCLLAGVLARADAVLLLALPLAEFARRSPRRAWPYLGALALAGGGLLAWMIASAGEWTWRAADGLRLVRLVVVPWSGLPAWVSVCGFLLLGLGVVAGARHETRPPMRVLAFLFALTAVFLAGSVTSWAPAGRYTLMATLPAALLVAGSCPWPGTSARTVAAVVLLLAFASLHLGSAWLGRTQGELREISRNETSLYRWAESIETVLPAEIEVIDAPVMGWHSSAPDIENVLSCAALRQVEVVAGAGFRLRWTGTAWQAETPGP